MALRFTVNSTVLTNEPKGEVKIFQRRDKEINGLFFNFTSTLEFWGDGFDLIDTSIDDDYCGDIPVLIETDDCHEGTYETLFEGFILKNNIEEYDIDKCTIKSQIVDNSYNAKILNNRNIKILIGAEESKNGVTITPPSAVNIDFFDPTAGSQVYGYADRESYKLFDVFTFVIDYITDGEMSVESDVFDAGGDYENHYILSGQELRAGSGLGEAPSISFQEVYDNAKKKFNLGFSIIDVAGVPTIKIEKSQDFELSTGAINLNSIGGIKLSYNKDELYADINVGSKEVNFENTLALPPFRIKSFREENFAIAGNCNTDKSLDLVNDWIIDSNTIERTLAGSSNSENDTKYDQNTFLVQTNLDIQARKSNPFGTPVSQGTTDATTANKLEDSTADFISDGVATTDLAINLTTGEVAAVTAVDDLNTLSLDNDIFVTGQTYQIVSGDFIYNESLLNINVLKRWKNKFHSSLIAQLGAVDNDFDATTTIPFTRSSFPVTLGSGSPNAVIYDNEVTDPDNVYDDTTGQYTPAAGLYGVKVTANFRGVGSVGSEQITSGDFNADTGWNFSGNPAWARIGGKAVAAGGTGYPLFQAITINPDTIYRIQFTISGHISGSLSVRLGTSPFIGEIPIATESANGTYTVDFNTTGLGSLAYILFYPVGFVSFNLDDVSVKPGTKFTITSRIRKFDGTNLIDSFEQDSVMTCPPSRAIALTPIDFSSPPFIVDSHIVVSDFVITLDTGTSAQISMDSGAEFQSVFTENGGGDLQGTESDNFPRFVYDFETFVSKSDIDVIFDNPSDAIIFNRSGNDDDNVIAWRDEIEWDHKTTRTRFKVRSVQKISK